MFMEFGLEQTYTLECNYNDGPYVNQLAPLEGEDQTKIRRRPIAYTPVHFMDVGRGLVLACLDSIDANPRSRLPASSLGSLEELDAWLHRSSTSLVHSFLTHWSAE